MKGKQQSPCPSASAAFALPLALIVLLIGSLFVGTAFYLTNQYVTSARHGEVSQELYNLAQDGIERGKAYLLSGGIRSQDVVFSVTEGEFSLQVTLLPAWIESPDRPYVSPPIAGGGNPTVGEGTSAAISPSVMETLGEEMTSLSLRNYLIRSRASGKGRTRTIETLVEVTQ